MSDHADSASPRLAPERGGDVDRPHLRWIASQLEEHAARIRKAVDAPAAEPGAEYVTSERDTRGPTDIDDHPAPSRAPSEAATERHAPSWIREALATVVNREGLEAGSNTPDFILAEFMADTLAAFDRASRAREEWYGVHHEPGQSAPAPSPARKALEEALGRLEATIREWQLNAERARDEAATERDFDSAAMFDHHAHVYENVVERIQAEAQTK